MKNSIPKNWKYCATCRNWCGERRPADPWANNVEYEANSTGKCQGGGWNQADRQAMGTCNKWEPQYR